MSTVGLPESAALERLLLVRLKQIRLEIALLLRRFPELKTRSLDGSAVRFNGRPHNRDRRLRGRSQRAGRSKVASATFSRGSRQ